MYIDANFLYGHSMSQPLPYDEIKFDGNVELEGKSNTPDDSDIGYFVEVDIKYSNHMKEKTKIFPFSPGKKINPVDFVPNMNELEPNIYTRKKDVNL